MARTCSSLRRLLHRSRGTLADAERLELEAHLEQCARCAAEVDAVAAIRALVSRVPSRPLGQQRIARAIEQAFATAAERGGERTAGSRRRTWMLAAGVAASIATVAVFVWSSDDVDSRRAASDGSPAARDRVIRGEIHAEGRSLAASVPIPSGVSLMSATDAVLDLGPARVELTPRTEVAWDLERHTLHLEAGRVDLAVDPTPQRRLRVVTRAFIVEVAGARFQVTPDRVTVADGVVVVLDAGGNTQIIELRTAESWHVAPLPPATIERAPPAAQGISPERSAPMGAAASEVRSSAGAWLTRARRALARGDVGEAREAARGALAATPSHEEAAEARTLLAACAQIAGDPAGAIRLYLDVAHRYRELRAGETALFAAARLEVSRGRTDRARALLHRYLQAYPSGSFADDARTRLRALGEGRDN
jgi:ferric-dicitrate binding protein FerR (iron transport regulator)